MRFPTRSIARSTSMPRGPSSPEKRSPTTTERNISISSSSPSAANARLAGRSRSGARRLQAASATDSGRKQGRRAVKGKIGLEEHFAIEDTLSDSKGFLPDDVWPELRGRLIDIHDRRIAEMDRHGVEMMVLSLNAPAIQAIPDPARANEVARRANDFLVEQV